MKQMKDNYTGKIITCPTTMRTRILVGIPMTGLLRSEWVLARYGQVIPCNWSQVDCIQWIDQCSPLGFLVADARNLVVKAAIEGNFEWLFFIDHDTILPPTTILRWNERMLKADVPVWSGLYFTKSVPSEPLVYRGRGNSYYTKWKLGDEVWVDGIPMGCTVIHCSILQAMWKEAEEYEVTRGIKTRKVFETPCKTFYDPEKMTWFNATGTEDLDWCTRVIEGEYFKKAGWSKYQRRKYPFLIDTNIFCRHIDWDGVQYPSRGEEQYFMRK